MNTQIVRSKDLPKIIGLSRAACWRLSKDPLSGFPKKIKLTANGTCIGYRLSEIEDWLTDRQAANGEG